MLRRGAVLLVLGLLAPSAGEGQQAMLTFDTIEGRYRLIFDPAKLPSDRMMELARLSPPREHELFMPSFLELCIQGDPEYRDCGTRKPDAPNFYWNAEINLQKSRGVLAFLQGLAYPVELSPVVKYFVDNRSFYHCLDQARLRFLKSWDTRALNVTCGGIDAEVECSGVLGEMRSVQSKEATYDLATHKWHNCLNNHFRNQIGGYPMKAWQDFLRAYGVKEELIEEGH